MPHQKNTAVNCAQGINHCQHGFKEVQYAFGCSYECIYDLVGKRVNVLLFTDMFVVTLWWGPSCEVWISIEDGDLEIHLGKDVNRQETERKFKLHLLNFNPLSAVIWGEKLLLNGFSCHYIQALQGLV